MFFTKVFQLSIYMCMLFKVHYIFSHDKKTWSMKREAINWQNNEKTNKFATNNHIQIIVNVFMLKMEPLLWK